MGVLAGALLTGQALPAAAGTVPLPRAKPAIGNPEHPPQGRQLKSRSKVPLPRTKPAPGELHVRFDATSERTGIIGPLKAGAAGAIEVSLQDLGRERDPDSARELDPGTASRWSVADIRSARDRCAFVLAATNLLAEPDEPTGGPEGCGIAAPVRIAAFGAVDVKPEATLNCPMALAVYKWMTDTVQPAARKYFGEPVVAIRNAASYTCRRRNNAGRGRISEHAFGNALDISAFTLSSGRSISIEEDWSTLGSMLGISGTASFLKAIHAGACQTFATVMGPRANANHENHFHVDLGRGGHYRYCR